MKKSLTCIFLILTLISGLINASAAEYINSKEIYYYVNQSPYYDQTGYSGLQGYNSSETIYCGSGAPYITLRPELIQGGKYKVSFYNVPWTNNIKEIEVCVYDKDGNRLSQQLIDHVNGKTDFYELGTFDFSSGYSGYVTFGYPNGVITTGYARGNVIKYEMLEGYDDFIDINFTETEYTPTTKVLPEKEAYIPSNPDTAQKIYVAEGGSGDGSLSNPFGTITDAQTRVRELIAAGKASAGITIYIKGGTYHITETLSFDERDSGTESAPVIYEAYDGEVIFTGAYVFAPESAKAITDERIRSLFDEETADKLRYIDLSEQGMDIDYISPQLSQWANVSFPEKMEIGGQSYNMSQYPNIGEAELELIDQSTRGANEQKRNKGGAYSIANVPRAALWTDEKQILCNGKFSTGYEVMSTLVTAIEPEKMYISFLKAGALYNRSHPTVVFKNILRETDMPGEYYIDRDNDILYYYPYSYSNDDIFVCKDSYNGIQLKSGANNIVFKGISLKMFNGTGIVFDDGSENCMFAGGELSTLSYGANIKGKKNTVRDCDVHSIDFNGIALSGGDTYKFEKGENTVCNNTITNTGTAGTTAMHGIHLTGCGNNVVNNFIHDIKGQGILWGGTRQNMSYNIIQHVCLEFTDAGAVYTASDFVWGTEIKYNIISDVTGEDGGRGNKGIYFDNGTVGNVLAEGNIIKNAQNMFTLTGTNMTLTNNVMIFDSEVRSSIGAFSLGDTIINSGAKEQYDVLYPQYDKEAAKAYDIKAYEFLSGEDGKVTRNKKAFNNIIFNAGAAVKESFISTTMSASFAQYGGEASGNLFYDEKPEKADYSDIPWEQIITDNSSAYEIPIEEIGIYKGGMRTSESLTFSENTPLAFDLFYPENHAVNVPTTVAFSWQNLKKLGNKEEKLYIAENPEFTDNLKIFYGDAGSFELELDPATIYYWTVENISAFSYGSKFNNGGIHSFTTKSFDDLYTEKKVEAEVLIRDTVEGTGFMQYSSGAKKALNDAYTAIDANEENSEKKYNLLSEAVDEFKKAQEMRSELSTLVYNDMETDLIGDRSLTFFVRNGRKDTPALVEYEDGNTSNKVTTIRIDKLSEGNAPYGFDMAFPNQNNYVEVYTSVKMNTDDAVMSVQLGPLELYHYDDYKHYPEKTSAIVTFENGKIIPSYDKSYPVMNYETSVWYDVCMKIDAANNMYDVYINGELLADKIPFNTNPEIWQGIAKYVVTESNGIGSGSGAHLSPVGSSFSIDNVIIRAPKNYGVNNYLRSLSVNGKSVSGFSSNTYFYNVDMTADELKNAVVTYDKSENAMVRVYNSDNRVYVSVMAGNNSDILIYTLNPTK